MHVTKTANTRRPYLSVHNFVPTNMDMDADATFGRYGTVRVLSKKAPHSPFLSYPVDQERISFGRDTSCDVRMYFVQVDEVSCNLIFEEYKVGAI
jgi:hypothetical protein